MDKDLRLMAGLVPAGRNEDGEIEYMGSDENWNKYEELRSEADEVVRDF